MDANLQDLFAVQKGMKLVVREVREEFGVCLFAAGNRSTLKEFSRPCRLGVASLDEEGKLNLSCSHDGFTFRHFVLLSVHRAIQR